MKMIDAAIKAHDYAFMLESKYGLRHFETGPPVEVNKPEYFRRHLHPDYMAIYKDAKSLIV